MVTGLLETSAGLREAPGSPAPAKSSYGLWLPGVCRRRFRDSYLPEQSIPFNELVQHEFSDNKFETAFDLDERFLREININRMHCFYRISNNDHDAPAIAARLAQRIGTQLILPKVEPLFLLDDNHLNFVQRSVGQQRFSAS
jgi:hypothetical protein